MHPRSIAALVVLLATLGPLTADWSRFRGPNGTGTAAGKDIPLSWTEKDVVFRATLPGKGHSSPIVVKDRVFLLSATAGERLVLCLDANTGKEVWAKKAPGAAGKTHPKSSLASATPCSDGERVYCVFWDGKNNGLFAFTMSGDLVWDRDLGPFVSQHGQGFSPVVVDGRVIVNVDQDGSAVLRAFDAKTGKSAWEAERKAYRACYSTPFVLEQNAERQLIVTSTAGITAYQPGDGKELWTCAWAFPGKPLRTVASSVIADGLVFGCSGDGNGDRAMMAVRLGGKGDVSKANVAWTKDQGTPYVPTLVAHDGHLYGVLDSGQAVCFEAKTGAQVWRSRLAGSVSASPLLIENRVHVYDEKGDGYVFAASPKGLEVLGKSAVGEDVYATPAVANGRLYVRGAKSLICVGKK